MNIERLRDKFKTTKILENEPLSTYTYTKIGGNADFLIIPENMEEFVEIYSVANQSSLPITILGNGSNLLIQDGGIRGITFILTELNNITLNELEITAQTGASIAEVSRFAQVNSLTGLEFSCGIPGSVGGAIYMNAGASGGEVKDVVVEVTLLKETGEVVKVNNQDMDFDYRYSQLQKEFAIVLDTTFRLETGKEIEIQKTMDYLLTSRAAKQPLEYPSCGSVFKRPPGYYAGKLIQDAGLQGKTIGGAQVSTKHAGFIVNIGECTATDYMNLISYIQQKVYKKFEVTLEREVRIIGNA